MLGSRLGLGLGYSDEKLKSEPRSALILSEEPIVSVHHSIAEDYSKVPKLKKLALDSLACNIRAYPEDSLKQLPQEDYEFVNNARNLNLPMDIAVGLSNAEPYWEQQCRNAWKVCSVYDYGYSWKRMFMERNIQGMIEKFIPEQSDWVELEEFLKLGGDWVRSLDVRQLLPPLSEPDPDLPPKMTPTRRVSGESGFLANHLDLTQVFPYLTKLEEFRVRYSCSTCDKDYLWPFYTMTSLDTKRLGRCVQICATLKVLDVHLSSLGDKHVEILACFLEGNDTLEELNLSYNKIGSPGAGCIASILNTTSLRCLILKDNSIGYEGCLQLAIAIASNETLINLDLRLNQFETNGAEVLLKALTANRKLQELNLASNRLKERIGYVLEHVLYVNSTLEIINLSCNELGQKGVEYLLKGVAANKVLQNIDIRMNNCEPDLEASIYAITRNNAKIIR